MEKEKNMNEEIKECKRKILNRTITTYLTEINDANCLEVEPCTE